MYVSPISTRLLRGMLTPAIRAMPPLPLPLLVTGVLADHEHPPVAADDLALLAHRLDRGSYLHVPFRLASRKEALAEPSAAAAILRRLDRTPRLGWPKARLRSIAKGFGRPSGPRRPRWGRATLRRGARLGLVPGRQDARAGLGHGDRELEVRGQR